MSDYNKKDRPKSYIVTPDRVTEIRQHILERAKPALDELEEWRFRSWFSSGYTPKRIKGASS